MARLTYDVSISLDNLICHEEGDGWGSAEPYIWVVFFRIAGDDVEIVLDSLDLSTTPPTAKVKLEGSPFLQFSPGSHGNLPNHDVDPGETVPIPTPVGFFETTVKPIQFSESLRSLAESNDIEIPDDVPGYVGVAVVVMEEDNVTDSGAEAGHQALNIGIEEKLQEIIETRSIENADIDQAELDAVAESISSGVSDAIRDHQSWYQNLWSWLNSDDQIGNHIYIFHTDNLISASGALRQRWKNHGDWELTGFLTANFECPAEAAESVIGRSRYPVNATIDKDGLRYFRDRHLSAYPGASRWWNLVTRNKNQIVLAMVRDRGTLEQVSDVLSSSSKLLTNLDNVIGEGFVEQVRSVLTTLSRSVVRRTRIDASRSIDILDRIENKSVGEALRVLDSTPPARYPE